MLAWSANVSSAVNWTLLKLVLIHSKSVGLQSNTKFACRYCKKLTLWSLKVQSDEIHHLINYSCHIFRSKIKSNRKHPTRHNLKICVLGPLCQWKLPMCSAVMKFSSLEKVMCSTFWKISLVKKPDVFCKKIFF